MLNDNILQSKVYSTPTFVLVKIFDWNILVYALFILKKVFF